MRLRLPYLHWTKRFVPRSLLGRTLLIMLVPLVVVNAIALQLFYGNHLGVVSRRLSGSIAGEIGYTLNLMQEFNTPDDQERILQMAYDEFLLKIRIEKGATLQHRKWENMLGPMDDDLAAALVERFHVPFTMDWTSDPRSVLIRLQMPDEVVYVEA